MDNAEKALIEVRNIKNSIRQEGPAASSQKKKNVEAVGGVSFQIQKGETLGIIRGIRLREVHHGARTGASGAPHRRRRAL